MEKFDKIIASIQKKLDELEKINQALREENASLKKQLGILPADVSDDPLLRAVLSIEAEDSASEDKEDDELSMENVFNEFHLEDDYHGRKTATYNCYRRYYENIHDFDGQSIYDLLKPRYAGPITCAIMIIVLEHYGIHIELPEMVKRGKSMSTIKQVYENLPQFRGKIVFKK